MNRTFNLADLFEEVAAAAPDRTAVVAGAARRTYRELDERANRLANHLLSLGIHRGDHVAIHAMNCIEWVEAFFACFKISAVPINVNYRYMESELQYLYDNADCVAVIVEPQFRERLDNVLADLPGVHTVIEIGPQYEAALAAASAVLAPQQRSGDDLYILYTGGTTGMPKGVMWRHEDAFFAIMNIGRGKPLARPEDLGDEIREAVATNSFQLTMMALGPMMHGGAQWAMGNGMFVGAKIVIYSERRFDADRILRIAAEEGVNSIATIGDAMARPLAEAIAAAPPGTYDLSRLFAFGNGGAPLSAAVREQLKRAAPNIAINDSFGASETGAAGGKVDSGEGFSAPRFMMSDDTTVLDDDGNQCPPGVIGKLARSGHIPLGYYKDEAKTAATFPTFNGKRWVIPGDFARIEEDGSISLLGRGSVCINSGGEKIFPEEVEAALMKNPAVLDAVVVGTPNERWGEQVTAIVQVREGHTVSEADVQAHCRTVLADYKTPRTVLFVEHLQRTPVGKADYKWAKQTALSLSSG